MQWKGCEGGQSWPGILSSYLLGGSEENHENSHDMNITV